MHGVLVKEVRCVSGEQQSKAGRLTETPADAVRMSELIDNTKLYGLFSFNVFFLFCHGLILPCFVNPSLYTFILSSTPTARPRALTGFVGTHGFRGHVRQVVPMTVFNREIIWATVGLEI